MPHGGNRATLKANLVDARITAFETLPHLHDPVKFIHALRVLSHATILGLVPAMTHGPQHPAKLNAVRPPVGHANNIAAAIGRRFNGSASQTAWCSLQFWQRLMHPFVHCRRRCDSVFLMLCPACLAAAHAALSSLDRGVGSFPCGVSHSPRGKKVRRLPLASQMYMLGTSDWQPMEHLAFQMISLLQAIAAVIYSTDACTD